MNFHSIHAELLKIKVRIFTRRVITTQIKNNLYFNYRYGIYLKKPPKEYHLLHFESIQGIVYKTQY